MKKGFTTGTCGQAATKAAALMLNTNKLIKNVGIETPNGVKLNLKVTDQKIGKNFAKCAIVKDSGDDPDVTNRIKIYANVRRVKRQGVVIKGGEGVGIVTKPGLAIKVGEWAINPVPRKMILKEASKFLQEKNGLEITISAPQGKILARKTFNPKLGIIGGISIIGTTGIVEPKSLTAYKASLALELDVLKAQGCKKAIFVLGYVGERFCKDNLKLKQDSIIKIGDHIGFMIEECCKRKIKQILLIGHIGKLIKLTSGQFNTHCDFGDNRIKPIANYAKFCGADKNTVKKILNQKTAEALIPILRERGLTKVFDLIAKDVSKKSREFVHNQIIVNCILLSLNGELLAGRDD